MSSRHTILRQMLHMHQLTIQHHSSKITTWIAYQHLDARACIHESRREPEEASLRQLATRNVMMLMHALRVIHAIHVLVHVHAHVNTHIRMHTYTHTHTFHLQCDTMDDEAMRSQ